MMDGGWYPRKKIDLDLNMQSESIYNSGSSDVQECLVITNLLLGQMVSNSLSRSLI